MGKEHNISSRGHEFQSYHWIVADKSCMFFCKIVLMLEKTENKHK